MMRLYMGATRSRAARPFLAAWGRRRGRRLTGRCGGTWGACGRGLTGRRRGTRGSRAGGLTGWCGDPMRRDRESQERFVEAERLAQRSHAAGVELEDGHQVKAVAVILDGIGELALPPAVRGLDGAPVLGDSLVDPLDGGGQRFLVEVGTNNSHNLIGAQSAPSFLRTFGSSDPTALLDAPRGCAA